MLYIRYKTCSKIGCVSCLLNMCTLIHTLADVQLCTLAGIPWYFITVMSATSWLRHCATGRKVAGSNLDGVFGIFDTIPPAALWPRGCFNLS